MGFALTELASSASTTWGPTTLSTPCGNLHVRRCRRNSAAPARRCRRATARGVACIAYRNEHRSRVRRCLCRSTERQQLPAPAAAPPKRGGISGPCCLPCAAHPVLVGNGVPLRRRCRAQVGAADTCACGRNTARGQAGFVCARACAQHTHQSPGNPGQTWRAQRRGVAKEEERRERGAPRHGDLHHQRTRGRGHEMVHEGSSCGTYLEYRRQRPGGSQEHAP